MGVNLSSETGAVREERHETRSQQLSPAGQRLSKTLWGIERFGTPSADNPPPIYVDLAWQLQMDPELRVALRAALEAVDVEQSN